MRSIAIALKPRLQESLAKLTEAGDKTGTEINISTTKARVNGREDTEEEQLLVKEKRMENITELVYFGTLLTEDNDGSGKFQGRIARATGVTEQFGKILRTKMNIL